MVSRGLQRALFVHPLGSYAAPGAHGIQGTVLGLGLGAPLAFDLGPLLAPWAPLALNLGPQLAPEAPWPSSEGLRWLLI